MISALTPYRRRLLLALAVLTGLTLSRITRVLAFRDRVAATDGLGYALRHALFGPLMLREGSYRLAEPR